MIIAPDNIMGKIIINQWIWGYSTHPRPADRRSVEYWKFNMYNGIPSGKSLRTGKYNWKISPFLMGKSTN